MTEYAFFIICGQIWMPPPLVLCKSCNSSNLMQIWILPPQQYGSKTFIGNDVNQQKYVNIYQYIYLFIWPGGNVSWDHLSLHHRDCLLFKLVWGGGTYFCSSSCTWLGEGGVIIIYIHVWDCGIMREVLSLYCIILNLHHPQAQIMTSPNNCTCQYRYQRRR